MNTKNICKFIKTLSIMGAGNASAFVVYQPPTPDILKEMYPFTQKKTRSLTIHKFKIFKSNL